MTETENTIEDLKNKLEEINKIFDHSLSKAFLLPNTAILAILENIANILKGLISLVEPVDLIEPANLLSNSFNIESVEKTNSTNPLSWVEGLVNVQSTNDVGLKLWLCTTKDSRTYFAHALNEDQARSMIDEIYGEGTVVNVFNYDNEYQVMTEL